MIHQEKWTILGDFDHPDIITSLPLVTQRNLQKTIIAQREPDHNTASAVHFVLVQHSKIARDSPDFVNDHASIRRSDEHKFPGPTGPQIHRSRGPQADGSTAIVKRGASRLPADGHLNTAAAATAPARTPMRSTL